MMTTNVGCGQRNEGRSAGAARWVAGRFTRWLAVTTVSSVGVVVLASSASARGVDATVAGPAVRQLVAFVLLGVVVGFVVWFPLGFLTGRSYMLLTPARTSTDERQDGPDGPDGPAGPAGPGGGVARAGRRLVAVPVRPVTPAPAPVPARSGTPAGTGGGVVVELRADRRRWATPGRAMAVAAVAVGLLAVAGCQPVEPAPLTEQERQLCERVAEMRQNFTDAGFEFESVTGDCAGVTL